MVGVGETNEELVEAMKLVRDAGVDLLTIGQYLAPSSKHLAVDRFPEPELYDLWAEKAIELGFLGVASGPFVRSSFKAGLLLRKLKNPDNDESMPGANVMVSKEIPFDQYHLRTLPTEVKP
tara:strand:- start:31083 stop:31445 length:363 start_codon:yes stop_codon:yes gene_type:complete